MLRALLAVFTLVVAGLIGAVVAFNAGVFQARIQQEIRTRSGIAVELGKVQLLYQWPPTVTVSATRVPADPYSLQFSVLRVRLHKWTSPYDLDVYVKDPRIEIKELPKTAEAKPSPAPSAPQAASAPVAAPLRTLRLQIENGSVVTPYGQVAGLGVQFEQKAFLKSPARVQLAANVTSSFVPGTWPVQIQADGLTFGADAVKASSVKATLAGLQFTVQGTSLLQEGRHRWLAEVNAPDLSQLPQPPAIIPAKEWKGAVQIKAEITREGADKPWQAEGHLDAKAVRANVSWAREGLSVEGPTELNIQSKFAYLDQKIQLPEMRGKVNLTTARVQMKDLIDKAAGIPLHAEWEAGGGTDKLSLKSVALSFWQLNAKVSGEVAAQAPFEGKLSIDLAPTDLKGAESVLLPLKASPVKGQLTVQADVQGPLNDLNKANIKIRGLSLKDFSGSVNYQGSETLKMQGPVSASVQLQGEIDQGKPKTLSASGQAELSAVSLVAGPLRKESNQKLKLVFNAKSEGAEALQINNFDLAAFWGEIKATGRVLRPLNPNVQLNVELRPLDLSELRIALPQFRDLIPKGQMRGRLNLNGSRDESKAWHDWPLVVAGQLNVDLPEYRMGTAAAKADTPQAPEGAPPKDAPVESTSFLPSGELTKKLSLQINAKVGSFLKDQLTLRQILTSGQVRGGRFAGQVEIKEIFGGFVKLAQLSVPLLEVNPTIQGQINFDQVIVQDALGFMKPEFKAFASGRAGGNAQFATLMPAQPNFLTQLKAKGDIKLEPITLNTVQVGQMLNDLAAKVPVLKLPAAKVEPLKGVITSTFDVAGGAAALSPLNAKDVGGSELELKGKIVLSSLDADLIGNFMYVNPPVKGCLLEGNSDAQGRLLVPLAFKGNLMKPEVSLLSNVAEKLAGKALECERKRLVEKMKKEGQQKVEKEVQKALKGILGN